MSYLEMKKAPLPDMTSGIISIWFRDVPKQQPEPPPAEIWPQDFWTQANASTIMVPPNAQYSLQNDPSLLNNILFYNPYGMPIGGFAFGDAFLGAACVWIPNSPPVPLNTMSATSDTTGVADIDMSKYGIRALLTFGDPGIDYQYCTWRLEKPDVVDTVQYIDTLGFVLQGLESAVPPYLLYYLNIGDHGHFHVANFRLNAPSPKGKVPQSFIGIDNDGHIVINLQTSNRATYKGMSFELHNIKELWFHPTFLKVRGPPYGYTQIGFPFPDGDWIMRTENFWQGYEFDYKDISQDIMGCAPESFVIYAATHFLNFAFGAPVISDGGWHHLLFSFDISGSVIVDQSNWENPTATSACKAWLALDDVNVKGFDLQNRPPIHDGFVLPKLRGTQTSQILDCGPCTTFDRNTVNLEDNTILPRNAWIRGFGNPKDDLSRFTSEASLITDGDDTTNATARLHGGKVGNFNWMFGTASIWPLYGAGVAPGPWQATFDPEKPSVPDTTTFDTPFYSCPGFSIPVNGHPIGVPAGTNHVAYNTGVEMAELQIWANKTLDTGDVSMRRLFLDYPKDKNGNPDTSKPLQPVPPSEAAAVLGKPDILLHGSGNWKTGKNTGTSGVDQNGHIIAAGQFEPTAAIYAFKPEPKLGG